MPAIGNRAHFSSRSSERIGTHLDAGYLAGRQGEQAATEFQKIFDHPQLTLTDPVSATATLGLARAHELSGIALKV
jgi:hypothetical protein